MSIDETERLRAAIWSVIDAFEAAIANFESKGKGGQHTTYTGDFRMMSPSGNMHMKRWVRDLRDALAGKWPMTRDEFVKHYPNTDGSSLDYMFRKRDPHGD